MAALIGWLADAGARDVSGNPIASGYAWFFQPGSTSSQQETVFSDADGLNPLTQPVRLDAGGRAEVFSNTVCQVVLQTSTGASVRTHDRGNSVTAAQVEVENDVATGTSLTTGSQIQGGRTDLDAFLTDFFTSAGAPDGLVKVGATGNRRLQDALQPMARIYDVTANPYGAKGDGITDDTVAVQAAITAAETAGGIVLVPPGTYVVSSLTIPTNMSLLGAGSGKTIIQTTSAAEVLLVASGAFTAYAIKFKTTGKGLLRFTGAVGNTTTFTACSFACTSAATVDVLSGLVGGGVLVQTSYTGCEFAQTGAGGTHPFISDGCSLTNCALTYVSGTAFGGSSFSGSLINFTNTYIEYQGAGAGTLSAGLVDKMTMTGCYVISTGGGALTFGSGSSLAYEVGTTLGASGGGSAAFGATLAWSSFRESAVVATSGSATTFAPTPLTARAFMVTSTGASFQWSNPTGASTFVGYDIILIYKNTNGGPITPTFGASYKANAVAVASGSACGWHFVWNSLLTAYQQVGSPVAYVS